MDRLTERAVAGATAPMTRRAPGSRAGAGAAVTKAIGGGVRHGTVAQAHTMGAPTIGDTRR
ncbi:hypothetical protein [Streptomyces colonosanans]|uniref:Uncharacterized protein n=1 Tax=Streptomyces colonosanans TaxID=1428652 RepID=A0A1S2P5Z1_9ACTN|nr:hypothetical protein [Streptomyces colonosanans]OIJ89091.1 hypothetical protein BIV24_20715 [Streptomyces colonosanans]